MENLYSKFLQLIKSFNKNKVDYIIIGGMAINLHGFARNTQDIDIFVNPGKENIEKLKKSLIEVFKDKAIKGISYGDFLKYPVIRYGTEFGFYIDIIVRIGKKFEYDDLTYIEKNIEGIPVRLADTKTLYKLKENTYREIDELDLKFLKSIMGK